MRGFTLRPLSDIASAEGLDPKALLTAEFDVCALPLVPLARR